MYVVNITKHEDTTKREMCQRVRQTFQTILPHSLCAPAEVASMMLCCCPLYPQVATGYYFPSMLHIPLALEMILGDTWRNYFFLIYGNLCLIYSTHNCKLHKTAVFVFTTAVSSACKTIPGTGQTVNFFLINKFTGYAQT